MYFFCALLWVQAAVAAQSAAKSLNDLQNDVNDSESSKEDEPAEESSPKADKEESDDSEDVNVKLRKSALDKLEKASEDSIFSQACLFYFHYILYIIHSKDEEFLQIYIGVVLRTGILLI